MRNYSSNRYFFEGQPHSRKADHTEMSRVDVSVGEKDTAEENREHTVLKGEPR